MITIPRFESRVAQRGIELKIEGKSIVTIKDHSTDKIIGMINLNADPDDNLELAELIIETIETYIENSNED